MKYRVDLTIQGFLEIEADSVEDARAQVEEGYSLSDLTFESDEVDDISEL